MEKGIPLNPAYGPVPMQGFVTSSYHSAALGRSFALALIKDGRNRIGETLWPPPETRSLTLLSQKPYFLTPKGPAKMAETAARETKKNLSLRTSPAALLRAAFETGSVRGTVELNEVTFLTMVGVRVNRDTEAGQRIASVTGGPARSVRRRHWYRRYLRAVARARRVPGSGARWKPTSPSAVT